MAKKWAGVTSEGTISVGAMLVLTLPTFAFSAASSLVPFYVPQFLYDYTSSNTLVGFVVAGEGIFCSLIPLWVGVQSDRIWTKRWGRRRPFMVFAAPFMAAALILVPFQPGVLPIAVSTFIFFAAYHFYSSPYQSLLPDVTPPGFHGRVQGYQSVMRGAGMFLGMLAAAFLFGLWKPLPFVITGVLIVIVTYVTVSRVEEPRRIESDTDSGRSLLGEVMRLWRTAWADKPIRLFMAAAFLWEGTLASLKPFIIEYFKNSLGASINMSGVFFIEVGIVYLVAGLLSGYFADRYGRWLVMRVGLWVYLAGCVMAVFMSSVKWALISLPMFGLGGAIVMTLPFAILMRMMPKDQIGGFTAMFSMVRGLANVVAPMAAGLAVDATRSILQGTGAAGREYSAIWVVCGLMILISLFLFRGGKKDAVIAS